MIFHRPQAVSGGHAAIAGLPQQSIEADTRSLATMLPPNTTPPPESLSALCPFV